MGIGNRKKIKAPASVFGPELNFVASEAYKLLRTNLNFSLPDQTGCKIIGVTSALPHEGKSTTSANLAYTMAQTENRVLLLEADMRLPSLSQHMGIRQRTGLSNLLSDQCSLEDALQTMDGIPSLWIISGGSLPPNAAELLASRKMAGLMAMLQEQFDVIIVDLPPITAVSDALLLSKLVNGMMIVVRQNYCDKKSLDETVQKLKFSECKLLGFVMTNAQYHSHTYKKDKYYTTGKRKAGAYLKQKTDI